MLGDGRKHPDPVSESGPFPTRSGGTWPDAMAHEVPDLDGGIVRRSLVAWLLVGNLLGVLIGRSVRSADAHRADQDFRRRALPAPAPVAQRDTPSRARRAPRRSPSDCGQVRAYPPCQGPGRGSRQIRVADIRFLCPEEASLPETHSPEIADDATRPMCATHFSAMRLESIGWTCLSCDSEKLLFA